MDERRAFMICILNPTMQIGIVSNLPADALIFYLHLHEFFQPPREASFVGQPLYIVIQLPMEGQQAGLFEYILVVVSFFLENGSRNELHDLPCPEENFSSREISKSIGEQSGFTAGRRCILEAAKRGNRILLGDR